MYKQYVIDYMPLANKLAWKYKKNTSHFYFEDIQSAAFFGLVDAASKYDSAKGSFGNFAYIRIIGEIKDFFKKNSIAHISLETDVEVLPKDFLEIKEYYNFLIESLNSIDKRILILYYIEGKTMKEIAVILNKSESRISQIIKEIKCRKLPE
jgi:RNA polymerase sigma factor (sigma-70 family)